MLLLGLASSFLWPITHDCGLCILERGNWLEVLAMLIKKHVFLLLSPHHPEAQTLGSVSFSVPYRSRISDELLPGFRTVTTLMLGSPLDIPELYPFCYMGQKCSCVAPGKKASRSQIPVSRTAPSLTRCTALSVLCPAVYSLDRKKEKGLVLRFQGLQRASLSSLPGSGQQWKSRVFGLWYNRFGSQLCYRLRHHGKHGLSIFSM